MTNWQCPKCGDKITTHIKTYPPVCHNQYNHSRNGETMEEIYEPVKRRHTERTDTSGLNEY